MNINSLLKILTWFSSIIIGMKFTNVFHLSSANGREEKYFSSNFHKLGSTFFVLKTIKLQLVLWHTLFISFGIGDLFNDTILLLSYLTSIYTNSLKIHGWQLKAKKKHNCKDNHKHD